MLLDAHELADKPHVVERIEKATTRLVTQAIYDFRHEAALIMKEETDDIQDVGEDITREALDRMGAPRIDMRLFGKMDYKKAIYVFQPEFAIRQALLIDSKAETIAGARTATIQTSQTSMRIRQIRAGRELDETGELPVVIEKDDETYITTTLFAKYNYDVDPNSNERILHTIIIACLPNGLLQEIYNPDATHDIWLAGRNAYSRGEAFRVRISFKKLKEKANWRVQTMYMFPEESFAWDE